MDIKLIKKDIRGYGISQFYAHNGLLVSVWEEFGEECNYSISFAKGTSLRSAERIAEFYNINEPTLIELIKLANFRKEV